MVQDILPRVGADAAAGEPIAVDEEKILLRLVDPNGLPVSGAHAAFHMLAFELRAIGSSHVMSRVEWLPPTGISDGDGLVILDAKNSFPESQNKTAVYILHEGRGIGAVREITRGRSMTPCRSC